MDMCAFFREIDRGQILKRKQITSFTRFPENRGKNLWNQKRRVYKHFWMIRISVWAWARRVSHSLATIGVWQVSSAIQCGYPLMWAWPEWGCVFVCHWGCVPFCTHTSCKCHTLRCGAPVGLRSAVTYIFPSDLSRERFQWRFLPRGANSSHGCRVASVRGLRIWKKQPRSL